MGCGASSIEPTSRRKHSFVPVDPLVTETASHDQKVKALEAIRKNDPFLIERALQEVKPVENLGVPGENYTCLHAAAQFNSYQAMDKFLQWLEKNSKSEMTDILNIRNSEGYTPALSCIAHDSGEAFYVMLKANAVDFNYKTKAGKSLEDFCHEFSHLCFDLLEHEQKLLAQPDQKEQVVEPEQQIIAPQATQNPMTEIVKQKETVQQTVQQAQQTTKMQENNRTAGGSELQGIPKDSNVFKILSGLIQSNGVFKDPDFKESVESICRKPNHNYAEYFNKAVWKRPNELFNCDFSQILLFDNIDPNDIAQGILGVCYFLCSISALAEFPSRLSQIFINQTSNKYGVYGMKMYIKGVPTEVVVDDFIPCYGDRPATALFSKPKGKELWVLLAEKIWGKIYKNYVACEAGFMEEALEYLTGTPAYRFMTASQQTDEIFKTLLEADKKNWILSAATNSKVTKDMGLVANHAYSIISVHDVNNYKIIKLRNPWGNFEWKGDFSDDSKLWTDDLKKKVGYTKADDGMFCMTVQDFKNCFEFYSVCVYNDGWQYSYVEIDSDPKHADYFKFTVAQPCEIYLRIHQIDERLAKQDNPNYQYSGADLIVAKVEADGTYSPALEDPQEVDTKYIWGGRTIFPSKNFKLNLTKPGDYIIRTKLRWKSGQKEKCTLSAYAPVKIQLQKVPSIKNFLCQMFKYIGRKAQGKYDAGSFTLYYPYYNNFFYICLENKGKQKVILDITFTKLTNLKLGKALKTSNNSIRFEASPGDCQVSVFKRIDPAQGASYDWKWDTKYV